MSGASHTPGEIAEGLVVALTGVAPDKPLYYAKGRGVYKTPVRKPSANGGHSIEMGFKVCTVAECLGEEDAKTIAEMLIRAEVAPCLLEALRVLRSAGDNVGDRRAARALADAAIAKATTPALSKGAA